MSTFDIDFDLDGAVQQATDFIDNKTGGNVTYLVDNCNKVMSIANDIERIANDPVSAVTGIISSEVKSLVDQAKDYAVDTAVDQVTTFLGNSDVGQFVSDNATKVMDHMNAVDSLISLPVSIPSLPSISEITNVFNVGKTLAVNTVVGELESFANDAIASVIPANANKVLNAVGAIQNMSFPTSISINPVSIASKIFPAKAKAVRTAVRNVRSVVKAARSIQHLIGNPNVILEGLDSVEALMKAGIDISALDFPLDMLEQSKKLATNVKSAVSSVSSAISSIGGFF